MKANNYKVFLKALGFAMLAVIGIVVLSVGWGLLASLVEGTLGKWGVIAFGVAIPVAALTALIYHMLTTISRNKEEE